MGSDNCVQSRVKQPGSMSLANMGSNRLFDPMLDDICPMSFYTSDRFLNSFEYVAEQASDLLGKLFSQQGNDLLLAEQANDLLGKELAEQASDLLAKQASDLLAKSRLACSVAKKPLGDKLGRIVHSNNSQGTA
ncbi:hypothetical protein PCANC_23923 [Puccinia coronata f. sp. avenae]|uniref:Uncharacterized protein n=1 Tax=Puccinia coronata f. sp. avenae TaxID=200324 RepID=A0A2N5TX58_9BASI|nr:hypothetical protein PCANC_23923 [Puccinia coronata f. sp. avenae]